MENYRSIYDSAIEKYGPQKEESERIPKKNFQLLGDCPLWQHLILELKKVCL